MRARFVFATVLGIRVFTGCSESSDGAQNPDGSPISGAGSTAGGAALGGSGGSSRGSGGSSGGAAATGGTSGRGGAGGAIGTGGLAAGGARAVDGGRAGGTGTGGIGGTGTDASTAGGADGGPPPTGYGTFTGVCAYKTSDLPALQAIGVKNARWDHPSAQIIETARTYGIEVLPLANYGIPELSGQGDDKYPPLPANRREWAKRMIDPWRAMQQPPRVIEVWNEPWNAGFWKPAPDPVAYLELVKAFAAEAWSQWPDVTLLVSAEEGFTAPFRKAMLDADTTGFLNDPRILPTTHNYVEARTPTQVTGEPCKYDLDRWHCAYDDFKAHGHPNPRVWVTEFGWESDTQGGNAAAPVSEALQAEYTVDAFKAFHDSGKVAKAFAFMFNRDDPWNYNWLRPDNSQKPVTGAVQTLISTAP
jgi:hypothetical protein